jgi:hypothetical protein
MSNPYNITGFFTANQLFKLLEAGTNITITKTSDCKVRIDASGSGGPSTGTKYHLKDGDDITVLDCFEYLICGTFILDTLAMFTIDAGGRLAVIEGPILNDGTITNNGIIKLGA